MDRTRRAPPWRAVSAVALVAVITVAGFALWRTGFAQVSLAPSDIRVATAERTAFTPELSVPGVFAAASSIAVSAAEPGVVVEIHARAGDRVDAGDRVATLSNPALEREVADDLVRVTREIIAVEGQIADLERRGADAEGALRDAAFQLRQAEVELERNLVLEERGFASPARMARLRDEVAYFSGERQAASVRLAAARAEAGERSARLARTRDDLETLAASIAERTAALELRAPAAGLISAAGLETGEPIAPGDVVFRVTAGEVDRFDAQVFESLADSLDVGAPARLLPGGERLQVEAIDPEARDGTVAVRLVFLGDPPGRLRAGQTARVAIATGAPREAVVLPFGELVGPETVWVLDDAGLSAEARPVRLGERAGEQVEVLSGVWPGDRVLVSAPRSLDGLSSVRIRGTGE